MTGKTRNVLRMLVAKPFGKRPLGRPDERITFTIMLGKCDNGEADDICINGGLW
jgi:hypothetical protein